MRGAQTRQQQCCQNAGHCLKEKNNLFPYAKRSLFSLRMRHPLFLLKTSGSFCKFNSFIFLNFNFKFIYLFIRSLQWFYPSAEMQSVYFIAPADWARKRIEQVLTKVLCTIFLARNCRALKKRKKYDKRKEIWHLVKNITITRYIIAEWFFVNYILSFGLVRLWTIQLLVQVFMLARRGYDNHKCHNKNPRKWDWGVNDVMPGSDGQGILVIFEKRS